MLVLILTVCAAASPCTEARLQFADVSPMQCALHGQEAAAQWADEHPGLRVARWRCAYPEREGSPT